MEYLGPALMIGGVALGLTVVVRHFLRKPTAQRRNAFLIIDVQNDFCPPNGSLAVKDGTDVIPVINKLRADIKWDLIATTIDWHPKDHVSFASNNKGAEVFKVFKLPNGTDQMMWPDHCVQKSDGAKFHKDLVVAETDRKIYKGQNREVDSYSGFFDNDHKCKTEMGDVLHRAGITDVYLAGLAYDYCVGFSALDAKALGFNVYVIEDGTRGVAPDSTTSMIQQLTEKRVSIIKSADVPRILQR